jgi:hypothetical protein
METPADGSICVSALSGVTRSDKKVIMIKSMRTVSSPAPKPLDALLVQAAQITSEAAYFKSSLVPRPRHCA